jgi:archaemetzincin
VEPINKNYTNISSSDVEGYGPNNFKLISMNKKVNAMNTDDLDPISQIILNVGISDFYSEIDIPQPSDWLWEHRESGQTFNQYENGIQNTPTKTNYTIYIQNLDDGMEKNKYNKSFLNNEVLEHLKTLLELYYPGIKAKVNTEKNNFTTLDIPNRINYPYLQYHAGVTLDKLSNIIPSDGLVIIGLTCFDLYPKDEWNFVYGLANMKKACGIFSFRRYYDQTGGYFINGPKVNFLDFVVKLSGRIMLHEVGHLFGLKHCIYFNCLLNGVNHIEETVKKPFEICPVCLRKIWSNLKFDKLNRFQSLADGLKKINSELYNDEIQWYLDRIDFINKKIMKLK